MNTAISDERLNKIEELLAHQDMTLQDLSDLVAKQADQIDILTRRLGRTRDKLKTLEDEALRKGDDDQGMSISEIAARDKPPHY